MQTILIIEFKGFSKISTELSSRMNEVEVTPERVRAAVILLTEEILKKSLNNVPHNNQFLIGGDTFVILFDNLEIALKSATQILGEFYKSVAKQGYFYLKPCICIGSGNIKISGERFLDDVSISTYRVADKGQPFTLWIQGKQTYEQLVKLDYKYNEVTIDVPSKVNPEKIDPDVSLEPKTFTLYQIDWKTNIDKTKLDIISDFSLPELLLDNELIFCKTPKDSVRKIIEYQNEAKSIYAFGGPIPIDIAFYNDYLKETIKLVKKDKDKKWTVISYLTLEDKSSSYYWLELARRLTRKYSDKYNFTAYTINQDTLIPFSYQIFDNTYTHVGLRSYSLEVGKSTMNGSIIFKNNKIAERYKQEFTESYRILGKFTDAKFSELLQKINLVDRATVKMCLDLVDDLLK
jgi:hypothetical protein